MSFLALYRKIPRLRILTPPKFTVRPHRFIRNFHHSRPQYTPATFLDTTTSILTAVHDTTGLSWSAIIPLSAITLRLLLTTPFTLYTRRQTATLITLSPITSARTAQLADNIMKIMPSLHPPEWERRVRVLSATHRKSLWKRWRCQRWKLYLPFLQLPVWFCASATIRALMPISPIVGDQGTAVVGESTNWLIDMFGGGGIPADSLMTEGLSWCTDLSIADPEMTLPVIFGALLFINTRFQNWMVPAQARWQILFLNTLSVLALAMVWLAKSTPAGLVLYWATSAGWSLVQNLVLWKAWPMPERILPCKQKPTIF